MIPFDDTHTNFAALVTFAGFTTVVISLMRFVSQINISFSLSLSLLTTWQELGAV